MAMNPEVGGQPAPSVWDAPATQQSPDSGSLMGVEWEIIERVPGDPWTAELLVWTSNNDIDGLQLPLDEALMGAVADVRRRQADLVALDADGEPSASLAGDGDDVPATGRFGSVLQGLGRSTGATQADRWLAGVPVRLQIIGGVAMLLVFVLVMIIGSLTR